MGGGLWGASSKNHDKEKDELSFQECQISTKRQIEMSKKKLADLEAAKNELIGEADHQRSAQMKKASEEFEAKMRIADSQSENLKFERQTALEEAGNQQHANEVRAAKSRERADKCREAIRLQQEAKKKENAALSQCVAKIGGQTTQKNTVEEAVALLHTVLQLMGKIKTTYANVKMFWTAVSKESTMLAEKANNLNEFADLGDRKMLEENVRVSAQSWACLGYVSNQAHRAMIEAKEHVDGVMSALPHGEQNEKTKRLVDDLQKKLQDEQQRQALEEVWFKASEELPKEGDSLPAVRGSEEAKWNDVQPPAKKRKV